MTRDQFDQMLEAHGIVIVGDAAWRVAQLAHAAGEQAERERTARLVADMQAELQTLRDRLARQRPVLWRLKDNPTITVEGRPSNPGPWEALGPIV